MCWRCCCWRAGPTSPTSAPARARWMWRRLLESIDVLGAGGRDPAAIVRGACLSAASGGARQSPAGHDRLFGPQQGGRHRRVALGACKWRRFSCSMRRVTPASLVRSSTAAAVLRRAAAARTEHLVEAAPHGAIRGVLRLTEQGEVVNQSYGLRPIAMRTLERTFAAVALATAHAASARGCAGAACGHAHHCRAQPRGVSRGWYSAAAQFFEYFRAATPLDVIERMHIGSRPAMRAGGEGIGCPARHSLGVRVDAEPPHAARLVRLRQRPAGGDRGARRGRSSAKMVAHWPFFRHLLDDVEAMLARTDLDIAAHYDALGGRGPARAGRTHSPGIRSDG